MRIKTCCSIPYFKSDRLTNMHSMIMFTECPHKLFQRHNAIITLLKDQVKRNVG